jgi:hypothetical protein
VKEGFGQNPAAVLADGLNATGPNIVGLEQQGVEFLSPAAASEPIAENPAVLVAWTGEGSDGVVMGVYGLQSTEA